MRILTISLFFCCIFISVDAQISFSTPSSLSTAGTSVSDLKHWTPFHNPANSTSVGMPQIVCRVDNRYLLSELTTSCLSLAYPSSVGVAALSFSHFGYSLYHEMMAGFSFARNFSDKFSLGVQFDYYAYYQIATDSYRGALFPQVGLNIKLTPALNFGFHTFNPFQTAIKSEYTIKRIPALFSVGMAYDFSPQISLNLQADKELGSNYRFAGAFRYYPTDFFGFQLGIYSHDYLIPAFGFELHLETFSFDIGAELHPLLGPVSSAGVILRLNSFKTSRK